MPFERQMPFKMHKIIFFSGKKKYLKKKIICADPTLPKIFRPVTLNTLIFFIGFAVLLLNIWTDKSLTLRMLGNFYMLLLSSADFFKIIFFKKFFQEHYQCVKQFGSQSGPTCCQS